MMIIKMTIKEWKERQKRGKDTKKVALVKEDNDNSDDVDNDDDGDDGALPSYYRRMRDWRRPVDEEWMNDRLDTCVAKT